MPKTIESDDFGGFAPYLIRPHAPAYVYRIPEAFYLGKHGAVLDQNRQVFLDLLDASADHFQPAEMVKNRAFLCEGDALVLSASANHFHWLVKMLPRLHLLERAGFSLDAFETMLINRPLKAHEEAYQLSLLSHKAMRVVRRNDFWMCRNLYTCSIPHNVPRWAIESLRELFARHLVPHAGQPKALYLTRGISGKRCVENESEVRACLEKRGFVTMDFSQRSFLEQIQLMANADVIVAPHGAALANLVFAREGTRLLEIFANADNQKCYWMIARHNRVIYHYCMAESLPTGGDRNKLDMRVSVSKLERAVDALMADPGI